MSAHAVTEGPTGARTSRRMLRPLGLLALFIVAGADEFRPAPKFAGKVIPDPPQQHTPWTPPETELPQFLVRATAALFDAGLADPRGAEYREVEVGLAWVVKTRGFVLPERPGEAGRFVVGWDGVVYPAVSVGAPADLEADVRALAGSLRQGRTEPKDRTYNLGGFTRGGRSFGRWNDEGGSPAVEGRSPLKLCLLLRLGRADLAESLFAAGTVWTPDGPRPDLTDYGITFLTLADEWGQSAYDRLMAAHGRRDDALALDAARRLDTFAKAVEAKAEAMGFLRAELHRYGSPGPAPYIGPFDQLAVLLADQERRAKEPPRGPILPHGGDPSARVAALIRDFDQIKVVQMRSPGSADPGGGEAVRDLIAEGDAAVAPLLDALENDTRLTRSISMGRGGGPEHVHPTTDAIYAALRRILKADRFLENGHDYSARNTPEGRKRLSAAIRAFWEKNRSVPLAERWYRTLRDDSAGADRWIEAAAGMAGTDGTEWNPHFGFVTVVRTPRPGQPLAMAGEAYRSRRDPSVSDLMARRAAEIARESPATIPDVGLLRACRLGLTFAKWDRAAAMPTLRTLMTACRERSLDTTYGPSDHGYAHQIAQITLLRARAGDLGALDEFAAWAKAVHPKAISNAPIASLEPMWTHPDRPAMAASARAMFTDPKSPWLPLVPRDQARHFFSFHEPIHSVLLCVPWFREAVLAALADRATVGTVYPAEKGSIPYRLAWGISSSFGGPAGRVVAPEDLPTREAPIRACDYAAMLLSTLEGAPECEPFWPEARRDAAVVASADYLRRFGRRLSPQTPSDEPDFPHALPHLRFPALNHPASPEEVREARAIFSVDGEGEARVAARPGALPIRARWTTLNAFPISQQYGDGQTRREYLRDGWVWQAEEVRKGDRWERSYGFVGHATIARVPASEIEFPANRYGSATLSGGLDVQLEQADPPRAGYPPGRPIVATLRLRNARGVERAVPTEFVRPGPDGKPALRRGVTPALREWPRNPDGQPFVGRSRGAERAPVRSARFDPGAASRTLAPTESFEAVRLDLADWFGPLGPGRYSLRLTFAADSGVGEGASNDAYFAIAGPDDRLR